jgi:hypothetical protein
MVHGDARVRDLVDRLAVRRQIRRNCGDFGVPAELVEEVIRGCPPPRPLSSSSTAASGGVVMPDARREAGAAVHVWPTCTASESVGH